MLENKIKSILSYGLLGNVLGILQSIMLARLLGVELRGELAIPVTFVTLFFPLATLGIKQGLAYYVVQRRTLVSHRKFFILITLATLVCCAFGFLFLSIYSPDGATLFTITLLLIFRCLTDIFSYQLLIARKAVSLSKILLSRAAIEFLLILMLFAFSVQSDIAVLLVYCASGCIQLFLVYLFTKKISPLKELHTCGRPFKINVVFFKLSLSFALPLFLINVNLSFDILMLGSLSDARNTGLYQVAVSIANMIWLLPTLLGSLIFSESLHQCFTKLLTKLTNIYFFLILISPCILIAIYLSPSLFESLFGLAFRESADIFNVLIFGFYFMLVYKFSNGVFAAKGLVKVPLWIFFISSILNIVLNLELIPEFHARGAAIATLSSYLFCAVAFCCYTFFLKREYAKKIPA
jgi:O-antigen/teichoic acid export membrane protein